MTKSLPPLLPEPKRAQRRPGRLVLGDDFPIVLPADADDADHATARALRDRLRERSGCHVVVESHGRWEDLGPRIELRRRGDDGQSYRLEVGESLATLRASGAPGLRYATETLVQLLEPGGVLPACEIDDAPDFPRRGLLLDVSRGKVPELACVKQLLELCARLKLNVLMLYTEHTFRFRRHPEIGADCSAFCAEELRELDAFAAECQVELVPTLQSLGHMERILSLPRYAPLDESDRGWTLSPADPGTYGLLRDLYDEYLPNFRSGFVNANCDEPWDLGRGRSSRRGSRGTVFLEHVARLGKLAREHGKRLMIWADFLHGHPETLARLDPDVVVLDWGYEADHDTSRLRALRDRGLEFWVCPGTSSWNALFPRMENALANVSAWAEAGRRFRAQGVLCTDWGDYGHYNLLGNSWLAFAFTAQQAWSGEPDPARFDRAFGRVLFGEDAPEAARCYRELGAIHDVGFAAPNASPVQLLFFEDVVRADFLRRARRAPLRASARKLERVRERLADASSALDPLSFEELRYAADATAFALEKALAGLDWLAWRTRPAQLDARGRRRLARQLKALAEAQGALGRRLRRLWLQRSRPVGFAWTKGRLDVSIRSLRRAARALEGNAPPAPPAPADDETGALLDDLRRLYAEGRPRRRGSST